MPRLPMTAAFLVVAATVATVLADEGKAPRAAQPSDAAVERTRETVKLLDNVYKQTIVLITEKYVHDVDDFPAGSAAVELFRRISEGDSHHVRLIDATGQPYEPDNVAQDDFERNGIRELKAGKSYFDQVVEKDGQAYLRAITPVPVVMQKCVMCHDHYEDAKPGEPIGALTYEVPIK